MSATSHQLVFELSHRPALGLEDFLVSDSNAAAVAMIDRWPDWPVGAAIICGHAGSGKSHLANVWRLRSGALSIEAKNLAKDAVPTLAEAGALIVEDIDATADQSALFHLLNLVREQRLALLLTSPAPPGDLSLTLPDLVSRLKALPLAIIAPPDDALLSAVLVKLFSDRQLAIEPHIVDYMIMRMERSMAAAQVAVSEIDRQALRLQKPVTRPVVAAVLEAMAGRG